MFEFELSTWTSAELFCFFYGIFFLLFGVSSSILFWKRRTLFPIQDRHPNLVTCFSVCIIIFGIVLCGQRINVEIYPCVVNVIVSVAGTVFLSMISIARIWLLYFGFNLNATLGSGTAEDIKSNWFLKNRRFFYTDFNKRFFPYILLLCLVLCIPAILDVFFNDELQRLGDGCTRNYSHYILVAYIFIFVIVFSVLAYKLRVVADGFRIKAELRLLGFGAIVGVIGWFIFNYILSDINVDIFPFSTLSLLLVCLLSICVSIIYPLVLSYHSPSVALGFHRINDDNSDELNLVSLLENPDGLACFMSFMRLEFCVADFVFWQEAKELQAMEISLALRDADIFTRMSEIYEKFFRADAPCPINLAQEDIENVRQGVLDLQMAYGLQVQSKGSISASNSNLRHAISSIFSPCRHKIFKIFESNFFPRFLESDLFLQYQKERAPTEDFSPSIRFSQSQKKPPVAVEMRVEMVAEVQEEPNFERGLSAWEHMDERI